jgi:hypothetical protein
MVFTNAEYFLLKRLSNNLGHIDISFLQTISEETMSKGQDSKKQDKKKPALTPKEKKEKKRQKKGSK